MSIKRWNDSAWVDISTYKKWSDSSWADLQYARRYDGSNWVDMLANPYLVTIANMPSNGSYANISSDKTYIDYYVVGTTSGKTNNFYIIINGNFGKTVNVKFWLNMRLSRELYGAVYIQPNGINMAPKESDAYWYRSTNRQFDFTYTSASDINVVYIILDAYTPQTNQGSLSNLIINGNSYKFK